MAPSLPWPSPALIVHLLLVLTLTTAGEVFLEEPASVAVILGEPISFRCRVKPELVQQAPAPDNKAIWYQIKSGGGSGAETITHMQEGRFFIVGSQVNGVFDLYINYTRISDVGTSYLCVFNKTASMHAYLNLLPESWKPTCLSYPNTAIMVGKELEIKCFSDGDKRTELKWQRNGALVDGRRTVSEDAVSLSYKEDVTNDETLTFSCSATLFGKQESEFCTIGPVQILGKPANSGAYIPYIIVGLLSVVVSMLFLTLLVVVFRHRQCRVCQREPPEPQTVLDMSQLQPGGPAPFFPIHSDTDDDDSDDGIGRSPPPDLIPTFIPDVTATMNKKKPKSKTPKRAQTAKPQRPRQQEQIVRNRPDTYVEPRNRGTQEQQPRNRPNPGVEPINRSGTQDQQSRTRPGPQQDQQQRNRPNPGVEPRNRSSTQVQQSKSRPGPKDQQQRTRVARSQTTRDRPTKSQPGNAPTPLRRTASNATLQENIDEGEKDKTVTGKTKLSMTNFVKSSNNKKAATSQKQNTRQSRQSKAKPSGTRKRNKQREDDAQSVKQLNVDAPTLTSGPRTEPGGTHAINSNDAGLSTNDISLDFEVASSSGQNKPNLNDLSENITGPVSRQSPSLVGAGGSNSTSASRANEEKVIYAELDFKKPVGLNILPDA